MKNVSNYTLKHGFTILELIITVIIMSILASLALPRMYAMIKRSYLTEAMEIMSLFHGRMEIAYVQGNNSYIPAWNDMTATPNDASPPIFIDRPEDAPGAHFCYTIQVFLPQGQSYQLKAYYVDSAGVTCPPGTPPGAYTGIPDYVEYNESHINNTVTYKGYGIFSGYGTF